jgi:integrase/recombinase XerD
MPRRSPRRLRRKPRAPASGAPAEPSQSNPLHAYQAAFLEATGAAGLSPQTASIRRQALTYFIRWCDERGITRPQDITRPILQRYQHHLYHYRKADGAPLAFTTQATRLHPLKAFFKWLARENHLLYNPASEITVPKRPRQLPKTILTVAQIDDILARPDVATPQGVRNRAILETLYSTGLRRMELVNLALHDVDLDRGTVRVRHGKGGKDRVVPIGARACAWVAKYLAEVRPRLIGAVEETALFLTDYGEPFERNRLGDLVKRYVQHAGIREGSCHLFRHAMATHMLENGADIRFIQAILGHSELSTTQIYTQVSILKLKEIHTATHPARLTHGSGELASEDAAPAAPGGQDSGVGAPNESTR